MNNSVNGKCIIISHQNDSESYNQNITIPDQRDQYVRLNERICADNQPIPIYENLCKNCGNPFGNQLNCTCKCTRAIESDSDNNNIYEDVIICDKNRKLTKSESVSTFKSAYSNLISGLLETIKKRHRLTSNIPPKRLEIIHNVDSVFRTNSTFDLSEIQKLKIKSTNQQAKEMFIDKFSDRNLSITTKQISDNELKEIEVDNVTTTSSGDENNIISNDVCVGIECIYENCNLYNTSLRHWMISLRKQTLDYCENYNSFISKSIPSVSFSCCYDQIVMLNPPSLRIRENINFNTEIINFIDRSIFLRNMMNERSDYQVKRKAIYFKNPPPTSDFNRMCFQLNDIVVTKESDQMIHQNDLSIDRKQSIDLLRVNKLLKKYLTNGNEQCNLLKFILTSRHDFQMIINLKNIHRSNYYDRLVMLVLNGCSILDQLTIRLNINLKPLRGRKKLKSSLKPTDDCPVDCLENIKVSDEEIQQPSFNSNENIYQSIWKFQTIGTGNDFYADDVNHQRHLIDDDGLIDVMNIENSPINYDNLSIHSNDDGAWEVVNDFQFSTNYELSDNNILELCEPFVHQQPYCTDEYTTICILYSKSLPQLNKIIYNYNRTTDVNVLLLTNVNSSNVWPLDGCDYLNSTLITVDRCSQSSSNCMDNWKHLLLHADYMEDEEDVFLQNPAQFTSKRLPNVTVSDTSSNDHHPPNSTYWADATEKSASRSTLTSQIESTSPIRPSKFRQLLNLTSRSFTINQNSSKIELASSLTSSASSLSDHSGAVDYLDNDYSTSVYRMIDYGDEDTVRHNRELVFKKISTSSLTYGVPLEMVEKDEYHIDIPKFVVRCIEVLEREDNICTSGLYRASGKKETVDMIRKKMNESTPTNKKYTILDEEDVHAIAGALKLFFRQLKTCLIPADLLKSLPSKLDTNNADALMNIRHELNKIEPLPRKTLIYLLKHLRVVVKNSHNNLMNASNLSIVVGPCILSSSMNDSDLMDPLQMMKINWFVKILIEHFEVLFPEQ